MKAVGFDACTIATEHQPRLQPTPPPSQLRTPARSDRPQVNHRPPPNTCLPLAIGLRQRANATLDQDANRSRPLWAGRTGPAPGQRQGAPPEPPASSARRIGRNCLSLSRRMRLVPRWCLRGPAQCTANADVSARRASGTRWCQTGACAALRRDSGDSGDVRARSADSPGEAQRSKLVRQRGTDEALTPASSNRLRPNLGRSR